MKQDKNKDKKRSKYTKEEIEQIKVWRGQGKTWGEISDLNGRPANAMCVKFSQMTLGVPEYKEPTAPKIVIPDNVKSINERNAVTVKSRTLKDYAVKIDVVIKYETLEEAAKLVKGFDDLTQISQYYSGEVKIFETNEIQI